MRFDVITIFPGMFAALSGYGVTGRAVEKGMLRVNLWNPRDFAAGEYRAVDDRPYGGGPGMVMMAEPLAAAVHAIRRDSDRSPPLVYLSPQGEIVNERIVGELSAHSSLILLAGRYEGIDERIVSEYVDRELSVGDCVISGGELAAMVVIDAIARRIPGVLGNDESVFQDSFAEGLLDCPHYTRPEEVDGARVPEVLLSGDHGAIRRWRLKQSLGRTWLRRPEILQGVEMDAERAALLREFIFEYEQEQNNVKPDTGA
jgi:tRNA (guanine37-N1)-methyltransferase